MAALTPALSHGAAIRDHRLSADDAGLTFPSLTEYGPATDAFQKATATGVVDAEEAEAGVPYSGRSSMTLAGSPDQAEKAEHPDHAKLVTWLLDDPQNPRNWSTTRKWIQTVVPTMLCFDSGIASSIITGGLTPVQDELHISEEVVNLTVSLFVVGFGLGPLLFSPLSEMYGRRPIYLLTMGLFTIFTIPCAVTHSAAVLLVFRFLSGFMASAPMAMAGGSIGDVWDLKSRGYKMAFFSATLFASPCLGPPIGGYISEHTTWRWIYGVLLIFSGVVWFAAAFALEETFAPVLLKRRATAMRKETGDSEIMTEQERRRRPLAEIVKEALLRPLIMLSTESIMIAFSAYLSLIYGLLYGFFFSIPIVFSEGHGFTPGQTGLVFFGILIGIALVAIVACPLQEKFYLRKIEESGNGTTVPESRLPLMMGCCVVLPCSLFIFAWTSMPYVSWVGPAVAGIPFGFALVGIYISANTYLVDAYPSYGASALAAKTFIRSLAGASVPLWIEYLYKGAGNAWAGSVFAFIAVGMMPIPFIFYKYGDKIRARSAMATGDQGKYVDITLLVASRQVDGSPAETVASARVFDVRTPALDALRPAVVRPALAGPAVWLPTPYAPPVDSREAKEETEIIEAGLQNLALVKQLRATRVPAPTSSATALSTPDATSPAPLIPAYTESRPYATAAGPHALTAFTLRGVGKFAVAPLVFTSLDKKEGIFFVHVGGQMCGHEGIVHGGLVATLLDEVCGRTAFFHLPSHIGVTATLTVDYKAPTFANQYLVMRGTIGEVKGRKAWVEAQLESVDGTVLAKAKALGKLDRESKQMRSRFFK
ncbi:MFS polyamine transporter [Pseudohyphozyma bogoriensis]|nr:MFS polyamine transporter [Pseudohyphozyma bogoriensis]